MNKQKRVRPIKDKSKMLAEYQEMTQGSSVTKVSVREKLAKKYKYRSEAVVAMTIRRLLSKENITKN